MRDCLEQVISQIRSMKSPNIQETLLQATLLIEKSNGTGDWRGISPNVDDADVSSEGITELQDALVQFARKHPEHPDVGTSIWALSKLRDDSLRDFFLAEMRRHLEAGHAHVVWQADCALEALGASVGYEYSPGETNHERYFHAVREFLRKQAV